VLTGVGIACLLVEVSRMDAVGALAGADVEVEERGAFG
jgi:hypothetical protein